MDLTYTFFFSRLRYHEYKLCHAIQVPLYIFIHPNNEKLYNERSISSENATEYLPNDHTFTSIFLTKYRFF